MVWLVDVEDDVLITSGHLLYASMRQLQLDTYVISEWATKINVDAFSRF